MHNEENWKLLWFFLYTIKQNKDPRLTLSPPCYRRYCVFEWELMKAMREAIKPSGLSLLYREDIENEFSPEEITSYYFRPFKEEIEVFYKELIVECLSRSGLNMTLKEKKDKDD